MTAASTASPWTTTPCAASTTASPGSSDAPPEAPQDADFLRDPDPELLAELVAAARGTLATMSFAPELPGAGGRRGRGSRGGAVPGAVLGLGAELGSLRRGFRADAVVVNSGLDLFRVMRCGEWLAALS